MLIEKLVVGDIETNCYILSNDEGDCIIIDPGGEACKISSRVEALGLKPSAIVLTHSHCDHILSAPELREKFSAKIFIHSDDAGSLETPQANFSALFSTSVSFVADELLAEGDIIVFGDEELTVIHTPGHTPGGISLKSNEALFVGDTIFKDGIGRTDLPGGDYGALMKSIARLLEFPEKTIIYPGHGPTTSVELERRHFNFG